MEGLNLVSTFAEFKELKNTYESQLSASTKTSRYDELSKGVDQFGRNVSLTDEEYSDFLSTSNELAEIFPELVVRTDEAGNSFLGAAGKVGKLTESINEMVKASQKAADVQLLSDNVFGTAFKDAKKAIKRAGSPCPLPAQRKEDDEKALSQFWHLYYTSTVTPFYSAVSGLFPYPVQRAAFPPQT